MIAFPSEKSTNLDICFWKQRTLWSISSRVIILLIAVFPEVADHTGSSAKQSDRCMPRLLHMSHYHNLNKVTDMQAVSRWIKTDIKAGLSVV